MPKKLVKMGSVEEEMDKLESSHVLDTSIESDPVLEESKTKSKESNEIG